MKKLITSIVQDSNNKFYLMLNSDDRMGEDYKQIDVVVDISKTQISDFNYRKVKIVTLKNGDTYEVFSDWSARKL